MYPIPEVAAVVTWMDMTCSLLNSMSIWLKQLTMPGTAHCLWMHASNPNLTVSMLPQNAHNQYTVYLMQLIQFQIIEKLLGALPFSCKRQGQYIAYCVDQAQSPATENVAIQLFCHKNATNCVAVAEVPTLAMFRPTPRWKGSGPPCRCSTLWCVWGMSFVTMLGPGETCALLNTSYKQCNVPIKGYWALRFWTLKPGASTTNPQTDENNVVIYM